MEYFVRNQHFHQQLAKTLYKALLEVESTIKMKLKVWFYLKSGYCIYN